MIIKNNQAYPIYSFYIKWVEDGIHRSDYGGNHKGLRKGRIRNSIYTNNMFKEEQSVKELTNHGMKIFKRTMKGGQNPSRPKIKVKLERCETWCLHWFMHWTFDTGQTDKEALDSFEEFVQRMEEFNRKNGYYDNQNIPSNKNPYYCLMGAEDRWRWFGNDDHNNRTNPPCRCKHCKEHGKIRINH